MTLSKVNLHTSKGLAHSHKHPIKIHICCVQNTDKSPLKNGHMVSTWEKQAIYTCNTVHSHIYLGQMTEFWHFENDTYTHSLSN